MFFDPNTLSTDGTVALGGLEFSEDGKFVCYNLSVGGSDWSEIKVDLVSFTCDNESLYGSNSSQHVYRCWYCTRLAA